MPRYAKVFDSIWEGSMRGKGDALFVFVNLLTHSDQNGTVDRHWQAIIDETGLSKDRVLSALQYLSTPDADSRTPDDEGRRIVLLDEHRTWGWRIVNHAKYRELCTKAQNAERQARFRQSNGSVTHRNNSPVGVGVGVGVGVSDSTEGDARGGFKTWTKERFASECKASVADILSPDELQEFIEYWLEPSSSGRFRFQLEKTWETTRRMKNAVRMVYEPRRQGGKYGTANIGGCTKGGREIDNRCFPEPEGLRAKVIR